MRICITGGAGFVGSHLVEHFLKVYQRCDIVVVDSFTYAGKLENLHYCSRSHRVKLLRASVADYEAMLEALDGVDLVIHAAAESHVDRSYEDVHPFLESNVLGTISLMRAAVARGVGKFVHVSTDEVYGDTRATNLSEVAPMRPTNPYAASKAAAEMFVSAYEISYRLPTVRVRSNNMFGTRQHPEKLIPKAISLISTGQNFIVHGNGLQRRAFLSVLDFCEAVECVSRAGKPGCAYNVGSDYEYSVLEVVMLACRTLGVDHRKVVRYGANRPYNDSRYGLVCRQLQSLGWRCKRRLADDMDALTGWYLNHSQTRMARPAASVVVERSQQAASG